MLFMKGLPSGRIMLSRLAHRLPVLIWQRDETVEQGRVTHDTEFASKNTLSEITRSPRAYLLTPRATTPRPLAYTATAYHNQGWKKT